MDNVDDDDDLDEYFAACRELQDAQDAEEATREVTLTTATTATPSALHSPMRFGRATPVKLQQAAAGAKTTRQSQDRASGDDILSSLRKPHLSSQLLPPIDGSSFDCDGRKGDPNSPSSPFLSENEVIRELCFALQGKTCAIFEEVSSSSSSSTTNNTKRWQAKAQAMALLSHKDSPIQQNAVHSINLVLHAASVVAEFDAALASAGAAILQHSLQPQQQDQQAAHGVGDAMAIGKRDLQTFAQSVDHVEELSALAVLSLMRSVAESVRTLAYEVQAMQFRGTTAAATTGRSARQHEGGEGKEAASLLLFVSLVQRQMRLVNELRRIFAKIRAVCPVFCTSSDNNGRNNHAKSSSCNNKMMKRPLVVDLLFEEALEAQQAWCATATASAGVEQQTSSSSRFEIVVCLFAVAFWHYMYAVVLLILNVVNRFKKSDGAVQFVFPEFMAGARPRQQQDGEVQEGADGEDGEDDSQQLVRFSRTKFGCSRRVGTRLANDVRECQSFPRDDSRTKKTKASHTTPNASEGKIRAAVRQALLPLMSLANDEGEKGNEQDDPKKALRRPCTLEQCRASVVAATDTIQCGIHLVKERDFAACSELDSAVVFLETDVPFETYVAERMLEPLRGIAAQVNQGKLDELMRFDGKRRWEKESDALETASNAGSAASSVDGLSSAFTSVARGGTAFPHSRQQENVFRSPSRSNNSSANSSIARSEVRGRSVSPHRLSNFSGFFCDIAASSTDFTFRDCIALIQDVALLAQHERMVDQFVAQLVDMQQQQSDGGGGGHNAQAWHLATRHTSATSTTHLISDVFAQAVSGVEHGDRVSLHVLPLTHRAGSSLGSQILDALGSCRLHFDIPGLYENALFGVQNTRDGGGATCGMWDVYSGCFSYSVALSYARLILQRKWKHLKMAEKDYYQQRASSTGGGRFGAALPSASSPVSSSEAFSIHSLLFLIDTLLRFFSDEANSALTRFLHEVLPNAKSIHQIQRCHADVSARLRVVTMANNNTATLRQSISSAFKLAVDPAVDQQRRENPHHVATRVRMTSSALVSAIRDVPDYDVQAVLSPIATSLCFNGFFSQQ